MEQKSVKSVTLQNVREVLNIDLENKGFVEHSDFAMINSLSPNTLVKDFSKEPLQMGEARMGMVLKGSGHYTLNLMDVHLKPGNIVYMSNGSILQYHESSPDFSICGIVIPDDTMHQAYGGTVPALFSQYMSHLVIPGSPKEQSTFYHLIQAMWEVNQLPDYRIDIIEGLVKALLRFMEYLTQKHGVGDHPQKTHSELVFARFMALVNKHAPQQHSLDFYASELCLTPRYLGTLIRRVSGTTAKDWIDRSLVLRAQVLLRHSDKQVATIADELGFKNPSFFCKFFKQHTGLSPSNYRNQK